MATLAGLGVLVTRPQPQAALLAERLEAEGARAYVLPALTVAPRGLDRASLAPIESYDHVVFVSANAVRFGAFLLADAVARSRVAVGPATAAALEAIGHPATLVPADGYDSEHLLATEAFGHPVGRRILIVRGGDGRALLGDTLTARGADVTYVDVYERRCATPEAATLTAIEAAWSDGDIQVVTATSGDILRCLCGLLTPRGRTLLARSPLVVAGARIATIARDLGLGGPVLVAQSAEDAQLLATLAAAAEQLRQ